MPSAKHLLTAAAATAVTLGAFAAPTNDAAATPTTTRPALIAKAWVNPANYLVSVDGHCSGAVLRSPSGTWVVSAKHCGWASTVWSHGRTFRVVRVVPFPVGGSTGDLQLLKLNGNIQAFVGGGFTVGGTPRPGQAINVRGYPRGSHYAASCWGRTVYFLWGYPEIRSCYLPGGTSGGPWYTADSVLHGVTGGLYNGGINAYTSNTIPFTATVQNWLRATVQR